MKEGGTARVTSLICIKATAVSVRSRCEAAERERRAHARSFLQTKRPVNIIHGAPSRTHSSKAENKHDCKRNQRDAQNPVRIDQLWEQVPHGWNVRLQDQCISHQHEEETDLDLGAGRRRLEHVLPEEPSGEIHRSWQRRQRDGWQRDPERGLSVRDHCTWWWALVTAVWASQALPGRHRGQNHLLRPDHLLRRKMERAHCHAPPGQHLQRHQEKIRALEQRAERDRHRPRRSLGRRFPHHLGLPGPEVPLTDIRQPVPEERRKPVPEPWQEYGVHAGVQVREGCLRRLHWEVPGSLWSQWNHEVRQELEGWQRRAFCSGAEPPSSGPHRWQRQECVHPAR